MRTAEDRKSRCSLVRGLRLGLFFEASALGVADCVETKRGACELKTRAGRTALGRRSTRGDAMFGRTVGGCSAISVRFFYRWAGGIVGFTSLL